MPNIVAHEKAIVKIFSDDYVFSIPGFQRPYAWTTEQAGELLDDFLSYIATEAVQVEHMNPYFLGSIVLIKGESLPHAEVVDGQQRLTTLTILLSAIRATVNAKSADELTPLIYERGSTIRGTTDRFRLTLRDRDSEFFRNYVQKDGSFLSLLELREELPESHRKIQENARLFFERLQKMTEEKRLQLAQFMVTRCFLVVVATPDLNSAYRIFSVLNSRGLDLTATDILKAELIGRIRIAERDAYTHRWEAIEEELGREAFSDLFGHIRMVYRKAKPQGTVLKEFREHVPCLGNPIEFVDAILGPMARAYGEILSASYESTSSADEVNRCLYWLNRLEFTDWVPPALSFLVKHRQEPLKVLKFFRDLERLAYSMLIRKYGINERIDRFSKLTAEVEGAADLYQATSALQLTEFEQHQVYKRLDGPFYEELAARARSAVLLRLDALLSGGGASYEFDTVTVEHVLPQQPQAGSQWLTWFPDPAIRARWVHRLGNLALLTRKKNSAASNFEFGVKKATYFARGGISPFVLTTQVLGETEWNANTIQARHAKLLEVLEGHFRLQSRKDPFAAFEAAVQ